MRVDVEPLEFDILGWLEDTFLAVGHEAEGH